MYTQRAKEIFESKDNIEVLYESYPVWIESVNLEQSIAEIRFLKDDTRVEVPISSLIETGKKLKM